FTVQMLLDAYYSHNFSEFFNVIESSKNTISEELAVTFKTFIKNKKHIENSLRYNLSNGPIEGIINKIKNIKRTGYGYRNFFSLKARVLIIFNLGYSNTNRINKEIIDYSVNIA
ncbi:transposase, partial [Gemella bergeri]